MRHLIDIPSRGTKAVVAFETGSDFLFSYVKDPGAVSRRDFHETASHVLYVLLRIRKNELTFLVNNSVLLWFFVVIIAGCLHHSQTFEEAAGLVEFFIVYCHSRGIHIHILNSVSARRY